MIHPSIDALAAPDEATARHLATCAECARIAELIGAPAPEDGPRYERFEEVHRGGMGRTVRARDRVLGRDVLLKELRAPPELTVSQLRARFEREARLTASLVHPAILPVYDLGVSEDGLPFYAMPFIEGRTLRELFADTPPDRRVATVPILAAVAEAIAYAHDRGVVHRDLKPDNVLVGDHGLVVVIDWGLAAEVGAAEAVRAAPVDDGLTALGVGTPAYMPPEQAAGAPADRRQDVYALGATLYEALAGVRPWDTSGPRTIRAALPHRRPDPLPAETPPELVSIVDKAMDPDPARRYADAGALSRELRRFLDGRLLDAHRYTALDRAARWARRHRGALGAVAAALVAAAVVGALSVRAIDDARDRAERALEEALAAQGRLLAADPWSTADALGAAIGALDVARGADRPPSIAAVGALRAALGAGPAARRLPTLSGWGARDGAAGVVWFADPAGRIVGVSRGGQHAVPLDVGHPWNVAVTADGRRWAVYGEAAQVAVGDTAVRARFTAPLDQRWLRWLGDDRLVFLAEDALAVTDADGAVLARFHLPAPADRLEARDGAVWIGARDGSLTRVDVAARAVEVRDPPRGVAVASIAFGDAGTVFVGYADGTVRRVDPGGDGVLGRLGAPIESLYRVGDCVHAVPHDAPIGTFAIGPACASRTWDGSRNGSPRSDGAALFVLSGERACVHDVRDGRRLACLDTPDGSLGGGFIDDRLAYVIGFEGVTVWDAGERLRPHGGEVVALAPVGGVVVSAGRDGGVQVDDPVAGTSRALVRLAGGVSAAAPHARGLVAGAFDGELVHVGPDGVLARARLADAVGAVAVDGERVWTGTLDGTITEHGTDLAAVRSWRAPSGVRGLVVVPTGDDVVLVALGLDGAARRFAPDGALLGAIGGPDRVIGLAAAGPGGDVWLRERDQTSRWPVGAAGTADPPLDGRLVGALPDGRVVTARSDGLVLVHDGLGRVAWPGELVRPRAVSATGRVLGGDGAVFEPDGTLVVRAPAGWVDEVEVAGWRVSGAVDGTLRADPVDVDVATRVACDRLAAVGAPACATAR